MNTKIYIIIVNYDTWADTIECLESVFRINYLNYQIIIVDNKSTNDSIYYIKAWAEGELDVLVSPLNSMRSLSFPPIKKPVNYVFYDREDAEKGGNSDIEKQFVNPLILIQAGYNGGFAFGNNAAIKYALAKNDFDYILLLNNDTVVDKNFLNNLIESTKDKSTGVTGCKINYYDDPCKIWFNGGILNEWTGRAKHISKNINKKNTYCNFITGACLLVSKNILEDVGLLDESYFMYSEDVDFSYKVAKKGYRLKVAHEAVIYHKIGVSSGDTASEFSIYWGSRNAVKLRLKNLKGVKKITSLIFYFSTRLIILMKLFIFNRELIKPLIKGVKDGITEN